MIDLAPFKTRLATLKGKSNSPATIAALLALQIELQIALAEPPAETP